MKAFIVLILSCFIAVNAFALDIASEVFKQKDYIPDRYTCDSNDFSPPVSWSDIPSNAKKLVLICDDPDAPFNIWTHWVLFNISPEVKGLKENISGEELKSLGIIQGRNDFGSLGYRGPCPPQGGAHRYFFKLYALDAELSLEEGATKKEVEAAMKGHIIAEAKLVVLYQR